MGFKNLTKKDLQSVYPNSFNTEYKEEDIQLYNLYRELFTQYIINLLELKKYDEQIINSNLNFRQVKADEMDLYQYFSSEELKYLYIRNNIYLERLEEKEREFLKHKLDNNMHKLDSETEKFIANSLQRVIFEDVGGDGKEYITFYGPSSRSFMARNDSLIIGMRYDEFAEDGLDDDEWDKQHDAQILDFLPKLFYTIEEKSVRKLNITVYVLKYNEVSIKAREKEEEGRE